MIRSCLYQLNEQQRKVQFSNYFLPLQLSLNSVVVSAVAFHPGDPGSISGHTFKLSFVFQLLRQVSWRKVQKKQQPLRITQILSPERASERKGMSTVERFIPILSRSQIESKVESVFFFCGCDESNNDLTCLICSAARKELFICTSSSYE